MNRLLFATSFAASLALASPTWAQQPEPDEAPADGTQDEGASEQDNENVQKGDVDEVPEEAAEQAETEEGDEATDEASTPSGTDAPLGPGGKPLRTDYPGTEESLKARMDTDMIEGLDVDPNEPHAAYGMRIRELETKIDDLKEKVFQSKTRIVLLRETLLSGTIAGARAIIVHKTELGSAWKLQQAYYALDGTKLFNKTADGSQGDITEERLFQVYDGSVTPGNHDLSILVTYKGTNVGLFPYFKGYSGDIKSTCDFNAEEGKIAQVKVSVYPEGGVGQSIEQRPQVKCEVEYFENVRAEGADAAAAADVDTVDAGPAEQ